MVDRCYRTGFPLASGRCSPVTKSDPVLTSPCVATETEELRKKEEVRRQGVTSRQKEERISAEKAAASADAQR